MTHDVMAISDRMVIVVMATCIVCSVQSNKKRTLHSAGPSKLRNTRGLQAATKAAYKSLALYLLDPSLWIAEDTLLPLQNLPVP